MPTLIEALKKYQYERRVPEWLRGTNAPAFNRQLFFASPTVYYPGSGFDGQPVRLCSLSHAAHTFVYVDYGIDEASIMQELLNPVYGFHGYEPIHSEYVSKETLRPRGWTAHIEPHEAMHAPGGDDGSPAPYARFVVLKREEELDYRHGPRRLAILFVGGDGYATFDALYCQGDGTPAPFMLVTQDCPFDGNYDRFGGGGLLERIALRSGVRPDLLLVENTEPWHGYDEVDAEAEEDDRVVGLFQRIA